MPELKLKLSGKLKFVAPNGFTAEFPVNHKNPLLVSESVLNEIQDAFAARGYEAPPEKGQAQAAPVLLDDEPMPEKNLDSNGDPL